MSSLFSSSARSRTSSWILAVMALVIACVCVWYSHRQVVTSLEQFVSTSNVSSGIEPDLTILTEADTTSTESLREAGYMFPATSTVVRPARFTSTTTLDGLVTPALTYLKRLAGDPKPQAGDHVVRVPVFMYHHIRPFRTNDTARARQYIVTPASFEAQLKGLVDQGYSFITPDELALALDGKGKLPIKPVLLTFDDSFREHYTVVFPLLKKYQAKATFFVISGARTLAGYLNDEMIREVDASGLVTIASHTEQHPYLARMSARAREAEIRGSKQTLETIIGHPITAFAYPYGSWSVQVAREVEAAGYALGFGVRLGSRHVNSARYQLRRIRVQQNERLSDLAALFLEP